MKGKNFYFLLTRKSCVLNLSKICMKETFAQQCLDILKREDIKHEFKTLLKPVIDFILYEINPYIYVTVSLVFFIFVMILAILILLILLIRNNSFSKHLQISNHELQI
jgi:hypothetical protein